MTWSVNPVSVIRHYLRGGEVATRDFQAATSWSWSVSVALVLAGLAYVAGGIYLGFRPFDDTYITFRYARNVAEGAGFVFNNGERVLGTTTPLWTLVLAAVIRLGLSPEVFSVLISLCADVATASLLAYTLLKMGSGRALGIAGGLLFLSTFDALSLARSGMETSLFTMLTTGGLAALAASRAGLAGALVGLATITRPEAVLLWPIGVLLQLGAGRGFDRGAVVRFLGCASVFSGPWFVFSWLYFGTIVPQSVVAKAFAAHQPGLAEFSWTNVKLFIVSGQHGGAIFERSLWSLQWFRSGLAVLGILAAARMGLRTFGLLVAFPAAMFSILAISHAFTWFPWYYGPFHASLACLAAYGLSQLPSHLKRPAATLSIAALIAAQVGVANWIKLPRDREFRVEGYTRASHGLPVGSGTVAALEIGAVGWAVWPSPVLDLVGLVSPEAVGVDGVALLYRRRPDYLVVRTDDGEVLLRGLANSSWFEAEYGMWRVVEDPYVARRFEVYRRRR